MRARSFSFFEGGAKQTSGLGDCYGTGPNQSRGVRCAERALVQQAREPAASRS